MPAGDFCVPAVPFPVSRWRIYGVPLTWKTLPGASPIRVRPRQLLSRSRTVRSVRNARMPCQANPEVPEGTTISKVFSRWKEKSMTSGASRSASGRNPTGQTGHLPSSWTRSITPPFVPSPKSIYPYPPASIWKDGVLSSLNGDLMRPLRVKLTSLP